MTERPDCINLYYSKSRGEVNMFEAADLLKMFIFGVSIVDWSNLIGSDIGVFYVFESSDII
jgi:hypothetical protein